MRLRLLVVADAERQIREAADWWRADRPAAPGLFRRELTRGFNLIAEQPGIGSPALDAALAGVLHLFRIRCWLYYRAGRPGNRILAVWHTSRGELPPL